MKEEILKRAMFAMPLSKEAQGTGIMSGFDMEEMEDDVDTNADMEDMPPMARTPQNPEILMNNLRGDMRSVDARYMELAQMVGEEAAMETPPEVLAMLMGQMGAQQAGIGALPQAQGMMPPGAQAPGAGMPAPDQMGAPQPAPAMPQGGIPMPQGMESAPPFSQGAEAPQGYAYGGEVAPPTPDGMPPMYAAAGAFASAYQRLAQQGARGAEALGRGAQSANQYLGNLMMAPQPTLQRMTGGTPAMNLSVQGRESLMQTPAGSIVQGVGTQAGPYMSMGPLTAPTFTQGLRTGAAQLAERFPRAAETLKTAFPVVGFGAAALQSIGGRDQLSPEDAEKEARRQALIEQIPTSGYPAAPLRPGEGPRPARPEAPTAASALREMTAASPFDFGAVEEAAPAKKEEPSVADFIKEADKPKAKTKIERIKEAQGEYNTMFSEILGDDKESAKINALLLLSEAGLKLASTRKPTFAMALADAASGLPRGMAAIAAQERELSIKGKSAALQQAITDVTSQDAAAAARQNMIAEYALKAEIERMKSQGVIFKDGGAGMLIPENKAGSRVGQPMLSPAWTESIKANPIAVSFSETDANPFVRDLGPANTVVATDPKQRAKLEEDLNQISGQLNTIRGMKDVVSQAYSPGTFFTGVKNQYFVPLLPDAIVSPNVNKAQVISTLTNGFTELSRGRASQDGRLSVTQEKWIRDNDKPISNPDGLLQNPELAAKVLETKEKQLLNEWWDTGTKLGAFDRRRVMDTPPTGTKNDPFIMPTDPASNAQMQAYLRSTFGSVRDPGTKIYIRDQGSGKLFDLSVQDLLNPRPQ